jgi:hypothetical protein
MIQHNDLRWREDVASDKLVLIMVTTLRDSVAPADLLGIDDDEVGRR